MFIIIFSFSLFTPRLSKNNSLKPFLSSQPTRRILILLSPVLLFRQLFKAMHSFMKHQGDVQEYTVFDDTFQGNVCLSITADVN